MSILGTGIDIVENYRLKEKRAIKQGLASSEIIQLLPSWLFPPILSTKYVDIFMPKIVQLVIDEH